MKDLSFKKSLFYFTIVLVIIEIIVYKDFIFRDFHFLYKDLGSDSYNSGYPILYSKIESLKLGEIPSWSFCNGLGENLYPFWLEPIALFITFVFFKNDVVGAMIWIQLVYSLLAGIFFFSFLRGFKLHYIPSSIFGLFYVFSGYMILHSTWMHLEFSNTIMMIAFLLFAWQRFVFKRQWIYFPLAISLLAISYTPVNLYFAALLIALLMFLQVYSHYVGVWKKWLIDSGKLIVMSILGLGMSCFMLLSNLNIMTNSPRGSGAFNNSNLADFPSVFQFSGESELSTSFLRLFSPNLQGIADNFTGWGNYFEAPIWYCGLLVLILIPQLFHFLNKKQKISYSVVLLIFFIVAIFPYFRISVWFYSGNYYRIISLLFCVVALVYACIALDKIIRKKQLFPKTLLITTMLLIVFLLLQNKSLTVESSPGLVVISLFLMSYTVVLLYWRKNEKNGLIGLLVIVFLEILLISSPTLNDRRILKENDVKSGVGYLDATVDAIEDINKENNDFFRIEKDYFSGISSHATFNEAKIQNYNGSRTYNSFSNVNYINFLNCIGELENVNEESTRWVKGVFESPNVMRFCSVKYLLTKRENIDHYKVDFDLQNQNKDVKTLKLKNRMPFGFTYDNYIENKEFQKLSKSAKQKLILTTAVLDKAILPEINFIKEYQEKNQNLVGLRDSLSEVSFSSDNISGEIELKKPKLLFFSIPFNEGWSLKIDGKSAPIHIVFEGLMGAFIQRGKHKVELMFEDKYKKRGATISLIALLIFISLIFALRYKTRLIKLPKSTN